MGLSVGWSWEGQETGKPVLTPRKVLNHCVGAEKEGASCVPCASFSQKASVYLEAVLLESLRWKSTSRVIRINPVQEHYPCYSWP